MTIERYKLRSFQSSSTALLHETFDEGWRKPFATSDNAAVHVAGIAEIGDTLVVVGTTTGSGGVFGGATAVVSEEANEDGFVTLFDKDTGTPLNAGQPFSRRIQSINGRDDWIAGLCHDPQDAEYFYIVGATGGQLDRAVRGSTSEGSIEAYIMKVKLTNLESMWTFQFGADTLENGKTQVRGISCAVDGASVWFGGVVQDGAVLPDSGTMESFGEDDIFVAKLFAEDGAKVFIRQLGSEEDDGMAMRGGLVLDKLGNCIVVGNTFGSFYRFRDTKELENEEWISDIFLATISGFNGAIAYPATHSEFKTGAATGTSPHAGSGDTVHGSGKDVSVSPSDPNIQAPASIDEDSPGGSGKETGLVVLYVFVSGGVLAAAFFVARSKLNRDVTTDRSKVIEFLSEFDVDDIDLKHSATGGWHCSYSNDLANGKNRRAERHACGGLAPPERSVLPGSDPLLMTPLTNTSVLQDSLFMDEEDAGDLGGGSLSGGRFSDSQSSHRQGYDGLIDAYNATWNERRTDKETDSWGKEIL